MRAAQAPVYRGVVCPGAGGQVVKGYLRSFFLTLLHSTTCGEWLIEIATQALAYSKAAT